MKVLVTGGTGFLGSHLIQQLLNENAKVTCVVRKDLPIRKSYLYQQLIEHVSLKIGDVTEYNTLYKILSENSYDYIFHLAGIVKSKNEEDYIKVNVEGTKNLLRAIQVTNSDIKRFVFMSSISAMGAIASNDPLDENVAPQPKTPYEISKYAAEQLLRDFHKEHGTPVTIVRAPMIYGYGPSFGLLKLIKLVTKGVLPVFDDKVSFPLVYVKNLVNGLMLCVKKSIRDFDIFIISDERTYTFNEVAEALARNMKIVPLRVKVPRILLKVLHEGGYIRYMASNMRLSIKKASIELGYRPIEGLKHGLKEVIRYYLLNGTLNCTNLPLSPMETLVAGLKEGEGLGTAYEYYVKAKILTECLTGATIKNVLIILFSRMHGSAIDVQMALKELGVSTTLLRSGNAKKISLPPRNYDAVIIIGDFLGDMQEIVSSLSNLCKLIIIFTANPRNIFSVARMSGNMNEQISRLCFKSIKYFDCPPFPCGVKVFSKKVKKINNMLKILMSFLTFWSCLETKLPNIAKSRVSHMVACVHRNPEMIN